MMKDLYYVSPVSGEAYVYEEAEFDAYIASEDDQCVEHPYTYTLSELEDFCKEEAIDLTVHLRDGSSKRLKYAKE